MDSLTKYEQRLSRFLTLVLRHKPEKVGITLDAGGWVGILELLHGCGKHGNPLSREELDHIVLHNDKKRFTIQGARIRAAQGHSIDGVDLKLTPVTPPNILYHGTSNTVISMICFRGILKQGRNHVHLSSDAETAMKVGKRHGSPVVIPIHAAQMHEDGLVFFMSDNGVWLTEHVPEKYLDFKGLRFDNAKY